MIPLGDENRPRSKSFVNYALLALNIFVFFYQMLLSPRAEEQFIYRFGLVPARFTNVSSPDILVFLTIFTSMFIHADALHLLGNMLYLWVFGDNIEDAVGHLQYVLFYLMCGVAATAAHFFSDPFSEIVAIGASGAISGVLGAYLILYPYARIRTIVTLGFTWTLARVPALAFLGFWFIYQILYVSSPYVSGVAYWAHIGGFLAGMILIKLFPKRPRPLPPPPIPQPYRIPPYSA